jgi:hypothetical protein
LIAEARTPIASNGEIPYFRYVVTNKGEVVLGVGCFTCHVRVLPDGSTAPGAQSNFRSFPPEGLSSSELNRTLTRSFRQFTVPWLKPDPAEAVLKLSASEYTGWFRPEGVFPRPATSLFFPPKTPDLIGIADRKYLDATGLTHHRSIGDLMRHASLADGIHSLTAYGPHRPFGELPSPEESRLTRYSDEQLYALALYMYALKPPPNPNKPSAVTRQGEKVFQREGCAGCHIPPLYTNNKLTPAIGFTVPEGHIRRNDVMPFSVGTDPRLAMQTRKATGYYRVPSLRGVWYRGPFEHNGSVATLEDWFDPARLQEDYTPTGFTGLVKRRAVKGHEFGLNLSTEDKEALIAFLKTLE